MSVKRSTKYIVEVSENDRIAIHKSESKSEGDGFGSKICKGSFTASQNTTQRPRGVTVDFK